MKRFIDMIRIMLAEIRLRHGRALRWGVGAAIWAFVALASAIQGYLFATYRGHEQAFLPTMGYTAAVFFVWAVLTPGMLDVAGRIFAAAPRPGIAIIVLISGFWVAVGLHLLIFVALFWPVYGSSISTPLAMAKPVFFANLDKSVFAYVATIMVAGLRHKRHVRGAKTGPVDAIVVEGAGLWIRVSGGSQFVRFEDIDWIAAAGDYAEVHVGPRTLLTDRSLTALAGQLPDGEFARIHRATILRLDRVQEVRRLGRGDASIVLRTGQTFRLSRRYRENLVVHLPV